MDPCIYCGREEAAHEETPAIISHEMTEGQKLCILGFTSRKELDMPNFITMGIGSECLKDMLANMERSVEILESMGMQVEADEIEQMRRRVELIQHNVYNKAVTALEEANDRGR